MCTSKIVNKSSLFWKYPEIERAVVIRSHYFKLTKEESRNRCYHVFATYWKWTPPLQISNNASKNFCQETLLKYEQIRLNQIPTSASVLKHCIITWHISRWNKISFKKYIKTTLSPTTLWYIQTTLVFHISKTYQKEISKRPQIFAFRNDIKICPPKLHQFSI